MFCKCRCRVNQQNQWWHGLSIASHFRPGITISQLQIPRREMVQRFQIWQAVMDIAAA